MCLKPCPTRSRAIWHSLPGCYVYKWTKGLDKNSQSEMEILSFMVLQVSVRFRLEAWLNAERSNCTLQVIQILKSCTDAIFFYKAVFFRAKCPHKPWDIPSLLSARTSQPSLTLAQHVVGSAAAFALNNSRPEPEIERSIQTWFKPDSIWDSTALLRARS